MNLKKKRKERISQRGGRKVKDLTAGLQDASNITYGASYATDVQNNSDDDIMTMITMMRIS